MRSCCRGLSLVHETRSNNTGSDGAHQPCVLSHRVSPPSPTPPSDDRSPRASTRGARSTPGEARRRACPTGRAARPARSRHRPDDRAARRSRRGTAAAGSRRRSSISFSFGQRLLVPAVVIVVVEEGHPDPARRIRVDLDRLAHHRHAPLEVLLLDEVEPHQVSATARCWG